MSAKRRHGKMMADINGKPLVEKWLDRLFFFAPDVSVAIATTINSCDDVIVEVAKKRGIKVARSEMGNLVHNMNLVRLMFPDVKYIFRGLGDCPYIEWNNVIWAYEHMALHNMDVMIPKSLPANGKRNWPLYGSAESPWSIKAWDMIVENSKSKDDLEHAGQWMYKNINDLKDASKIRVGVLKDDDIYWRPKYRVEVDTEKDIEWLRAVDKEMPMKSSKLSDLVTWLDEHPEVAEINSSVPTKTITEFQGDPLEILEFENPELKAVVEGLSDHDKWILAAILQNHLQRTIGEHYGVAQQTVSSWWLSLKDSIREEIECHSNGDDDDNNKGQQVSNR
jgi:spore coat polysaccharide biosynthesis protein SpsF (cytidylyltransferase family)